MRRNHRMLTGAMTCLGLGLITQTGCQTNFGGMTLPSPHYLQQRPQYFPPDPAFPLQREVDSMQDADGALRRGAAAGIGVAAPAIGPVGAVALPVPVAK